MLRVGADRKILRAHLQRRLFVAGAHPARARHSRRLRPAQECNRETLRARADGAARNGDDGLMGMLGLKRLGIIVAGYVAGCAVAVATAMLTKPDLVCFAP